MINWMVNAGDVTGNLVQQGIKDGDTVIIKLLMDPQEPWMTQEDVNTIVELYGRALAAQDLDVHLVVIPLPNSSDVTVTTLTEEEKENLREQMRQLGVIE